MSDKVKIVSQTICLFIFIDNIFKSIGHITDKRAECADSEILTMALIATLHYGGNHADAIGFVKETGLMPRMISESCFNRRLHHMADLTVSLFFQLGQVIMSLDEDLTYRIDSFPVRCCHNIRIKRSKLFKVEVFRGYNASKREYFYGIKVFVVTNRDNKPIEYTFTPASWSEIDGFRQMPLQLPQLATLYGDSGFTDYTHEEDIKEGHNIDMKIARKKNAKNSIPLGGTILST